LVEIRGSRQSRTSLIIVTGGDGIMPRYRPAAGRASDV
jgi:hypothetical protein